VPTSIGMGKILDRLDLYIWAKTLLIAMLMKTAYVCVDGARQGLGYAPVDELLRRDFGSEGRLRFSQTRS
jgi:hypothetical protein